MIDVRRDRVRIGIGQLLLVVAAGELWTASRLPWVVIRSFDGLGPPKETTLSGAAWSTALLPVALLMLAAAVAAVAVRGWPLRVLSVLLAAAGFVVGYLGVSLWVLPDVAVRGADLAQIPLEVLVGSGRRYWGAGFAVTAAVSIVIAAGLLMRSAMSARESAAKYASSRVRRSTALRDSAGAGGQETPSVISERMIWDALDEGRDPTARPSESDSEGR